MGRLPLAAVLVLGACAAPAPDPPRPAPSAPEESVPAPVPAPSPAAASPETPPPEEKATPPELPASILIDSSVTRGGPDGPVTVGFRDGEPVPWIRSEVRRQPKAFEGTAVRAR